MSGRPPKRSVGRPGRAPGIEAGELTGKLPVNPVPFAFGVLLFVGVGNTGNPLEGLIGNPEIGLIGKPVRKSILRAR
jgi:hypothetical protein